MRVGSSCFAKQMKSGARLEWRISDNKILTVRINLYVATEQGKLDLQ